MRVLVNLLDGSTDTHEGNLDVGVRDGVLTIIASRYQGPELRRTEYPLTSIRNWVYTR